MPIDYGRLTLKDALDLAILIEDEARQRYTEFTEMLGARYPGDAADFFSMMAGYETRHARALALRRRRLFGSSKREVHGSMFTDVEAPDYGRPRPFMSPRQAMEVALEAEEKAFEFYDQALPKVKDGDVAALFTDLRAEEQEHAAAIRAKMQGLPSGPDLEDEDADEPPAM